MKLNRKRLNQLKNEEEEKQQSKDLHNSLLSQQLTEGIDGLNLTMKQETALKPLSYVSSIKDLPLKLFIECCCDDNFNVLIKDYDGRELSKSETTELSFKWIGLLSEYYRVSDNKDMVLFCQLNGKKALLQIRMHIVASCVMALKFCYVAELVEVLKSYPEYAGMPFTKESIQRDLVSVESFEKNFTMDLAEIEQELKELQIGKGEEAKGKEEDFYSSLLIYEEVKKVPVMDKESMSTFMYAIYMKALSKHSEQNKTSE